MRPTLLLVFWLTASLETGCVSTGDTTVQKSQPDGGGGFSDASLCGKWCAAAKAAGCNPAAECEVACLDNRAAKPECQPKLDAFLQCATESTKPTCESNALAAADCTKQETVAADCSDPQCNTTATEPCTKCIATSCCAESLACLDDDKCNADVQTWTDCLAATTSAAAKEACTKTFHDSSPVAGTFLDCTTSKCGTSC